MTVGITCSSHMDHAARAPTPATTSAWADRAKSRDHLWTTSESTCWKEEENCSSALADATSGLATLDCSISATVSRSFLAISKQTSIVVAPACSTYVRCSGAMAGPWRERTSKKVRMRSNLYER